MKCFLSVGFGAAVVHLERKDAEVPFVSRQEQKMMCQQAAVNQKMKEKIVKKSRKTGCFVFSKMT